MVGVTSTRHIALLGGFRDAPTTAPDNYMIGAIVGGANLDLSKATLPPGGVTITKWSLVGGTAVRLPPGTRAEFSGFSLIGRKRLLHSNAAADGRVVRIRAFAGFGGVRIED
jgi:predicted membrane protein